MPSELEAERRHFYEIVRRFNETAAMQKGPVTMTSVSDKSPVQYAIDENIRDCRHYIRLLSEDWGPAQGNFEKYHLFSA